VQTPKVPVKMAVPVSVSISPTSIVTSWTQLTTDADRGYDPITEYRVEKSTATSSGFNFVCSTTGSGSSCTDSATHPSGVVYYYRVAAKNSLGYGTYSDNLQITTDAFPDASVTLSQVGAVEPKSMTISWTALPTANDGRDPVIFYAVELSINSGTWNQLNFDFGTAYLTYTHTSTTNFPASTTFQFRIRPKNGVGYSLSTSSTLSVLSDGVPNNMDPLTAGTVTPTTMSFSWSDLTDQTKNGRDNPIFYQVEWYNQITNPSSP